MATGMLKIPLKNLLGFSLPDQGKWELPYFLVGPENALVESAMEVLIAGRPMGYFPVVFYGPSGTGKSFLTHGLIQVWKCLGHPGPVIIESAQEFHRQLADALESQAVPDFLDRYYRARLWVLEDIDRLEGKTATQLQLARVLDRLRTQQTCVLLISCRTIPGSIPGLLTHLQSRLMGGLVVALKLPSMEIRRYFLKEMVKVKQIHCSPEAIDFLASRMTGSLGQLRKALMELSTLTPARQGIELSTVQKYLAHPSPNVCQAMRNILHHTARQFALRVQDLRGPSRKKQLVNARGVTVYLARKILGLSFQQIGLFLGNRDHTTILHSYQKTKNLLTHDPALGHVVNTLYETLKPLVTSKTGNGSD